MIRFLKSINIDNVDDFDMEFEMISRNRFNKNQWDMVILKATPWEYSYLRLFIDSLSNIKYPYLLRFVYEKRPAIEEVKSLFFDWYQSIYRVPSNIRLVSVNDFTIKIVYSSEEEKENYKRTIVDFRDFLDFINYEFSLIENVSLDLIDTNNTQEETSPINENIKSEVSLAKEETKVEPVLEKEQNALTEQVEDALLKMMKENKDLMEKERARAKIFKKGNYIPIEGIDLINVNSGSVDFEATVFSCEERKIKDFYRLTLGVNDDKGGAIYVGMKENKLVDHEFVKKLVKGTNVRIRGVAYHDDYSSSLLINGHYIDLLPPEEILKEEYPQNRVELHLHSLMSTMDGVSSMKDYCSYASKLGHSAMAITDHAGVQGYPDAQKAAKKNGIKMLYGSELYMVEDKLTHIQNPSNTLLNKANYVVLDLETTGLSAKYNRIIEFGAVRVEHGTIVNSIDILINPEIPISTKITNITGISNDMVKNKPTIKEAFPTILDFIKDSILVTHNANFDFSFLVEASILLGYGELKNPVIDTLSLSRLLFPEARGHSLGSLCRRYDVNYDEESAHRANYDAAVLNEVWQPMLAKLTENNLNMTHLQLNEMDTPIEVLKHIRPIHVTVLAKDKIGLKELYKIISSSHVDYLADVPKTPRSLLSKAREHLLIGSSCMDGEIWNNATHFNDEKLKQSMAFYDYIEVQPLDIYEYQVNMGEIAFEDVEKAIKNIIKVADSIGKTVVATGDVHYVRPKDKIFRDIFISAEGIGKVNHPLFPYKRRKMAQFDNPNQHYRSTKEMLENMSFLGEEKAFEIVVTNTNKIADMIEPMVPLPNNVLYTPKIDNCEQLLTDMVFSKAKEIYGNPLPVVIKSRLDTELNGIITHGFSVIYYIAHKLVKKTLDDGYIVGSRGSVGSSLVATMSGITEVNPLPPHYICPKCKHLEWTSEIMPDYRSGYDLPDKLCPICGAPLNHDGQNIPFETFLGFHAEKTPDIDLNFPRDYQATAHEYTKVLLGENNVFRAGTIETVADKTAFGYVRGYLEKKGIDPNTYPKAKISYLASNCTGIKRTTGQHPGGIVVIPNEYDVYDFTPIQYPANDKEANWKTTHFDFHSIHDTILKLDMLGHLDPMALKMMCDLTSINIKDIPMNDPKVFSLFNSPKELNIENDYLKAKTGAAALPEFGTEFVRGVLEQTKPNCFSDLVILSGITHGTDVWDGNAELLIKSGQATLREVIGCRDDIMTYLISKGVPSEISFAIMEDVRHGKGLKPEYEEIMLANNVPQYYLDSCNKIQYMFPKGHAVAYVTMAVRVGYFKIYHPLEFYAAYFSVRCDQFDINAMIGGKEAIITRLEELKLKGKSKIEKLSNKEIEIGKVLNIALEMVQRGYSFSNIDLNRSDSCNFVVDRENKCLIPPFITVDGLGINNAITVIEARKDGLFYSKEDLLRRTKLTSTNVNDLDKLGVLKELNETDQLSLFDF